MTPPGWKGKKRTSGIGPRSVDNLAHGDRKGRATSIRELVAFAVIVVALSVGFYAVGPIISSLSPVTRANVPAAALMFVCPAIAAVAVVWRQRKLRQLSNSLTLRGVSWFVWLGSLSAMPAVILLASFLTDRGSLDLGSPVTALLLALAYVGAALGEEMGWTGFAQPRLRSLTGELMTGLLIGAFWAAWHVIPYVEAGNSSMWIAGQCLFTVSFRLVLVRLTEAGGRSVWPAVIAHAGYNLAWSLSPNAGRGYDPWLVFAITALFAGALYLGRSLTRGRISRRAT